MTPGLPRTRSGRPGSRGECSWARMPRRACTSSPTRPRMPDGPEIQAATAGTAAAVIDEHPGGQPATGREQGMARRGAPRADPQEDRTPERVISEAGEGKPIPRLTHLPDSVGNHATQVRTPVRAGRRVEMVLVRAAGIDRGAPSFETRGRADDGEGSAKRRRGRACGFSSPVAPGTWAGTSSAS